jgi:hypothetical protein
MSPQLTTNPPAPVAKAQLTYVELVHYPQRVERWIRFGSAKNEQILSRRVRLLGFAPNAIFAFVRWSQRTNGASASRIDILQAVARSEPCSTVPGVSPGAEILLRLAGWSKVQKALEAIDSVEATGIDPVEVAPDHWRHLHHRIAAALPARPYTPERHAAWLARRELFS